MGVESYFELFTMLFSLQTYASIWAVLRGSGIAYLPFLVMLLRSVAGALEDLPVSQAGLASLKRFELSVILSLAMVVLVAQPTSLTTLSPTIVTYEERCGGVSVNAGSTGTTFDDVFGGTPIMTATPVPLLLYGVLAGSSGITQGSVAGIPCVDDLSGYRMDMSHTHIEDPRLLNEVAEFIQDCYVPARSRWYANRYPTSATYTATDTEWFGSYTYRNTTTFYDVLRSRRSIEGFPIDLVDRDSEYAIPGVTPPIWGRPYCKEWYEDSGVGLRKRLVDAVPIDLWDQGKAILTKWFPASGYTSTDIEDDTLRMLVQTSMARAPMSMEIAPSYLSSAELSAARYNGGAMNLDLIGAGVGEAWESISFSPMIYAVRTGAPFVQGLLLMMIIMLLPIVWTVSLYSWVAFVTVGITLFTIKYWSFIWHVARWMEDNLTAVLFPGGPSFFAATFANFADVRYSLKAELLEMAVGVLFIAGPVMLSFVIALAGYRIVSNINQSASGITGALGQSGRTGGDLAKRAGGNVGTNAAKKI